MWIRLLSICYHVIFRSHILLCRFYLAVFCFAFNTKFSRKKKSKCFFRVSANSWKQKLNFFFHEFSHESRETCHLDLDDENVRGKNELISRKHNRLTIISNTQRERKKHHWTINKKKNVDAVVWPPNGQLPIYQFVFCFFFFAFDFGSTIDVP